MPPMASSPRILNRQAPSDAEANAKAPVAVHHRSACSGDKALRNTSHAKAASPQALLAFRSLDPFRALREPDRRRWDEERLSRSRARRRRGGWAEAGRSRPILAAIGPFPQGDQRFESVSLQR